MSVKVKSVMHRSPRTCSTQDTLVQAAAAMKENNCGILPVADADRRPVGIVTDRDICLAVGARSEPPADVKVGDIMSEDVQVCRPEDDVREALRTMTLARVHRLPVVGEGGAICGILSLTDIVRTSDEQLKPLWEPLRDAFRASGEPSWEWEEAVLTQQEGASVPHMKPGEGVPIPFKDRVQAGVGLSEVLRAHRGSDPLVLGIPRRAVSMARILADALDGEADILLVRKLVSPGYPEVILGSVSETGHAYVTAAARSSGLGIDQVRARIEEAHAELQSWRAKYTPGRAFTSPAGRNVILVSDGMVSGATMLSALRAVRAGKPSRVTVAVGAAPAEALDRVRDMVDEVHTLATPVRMESVASCYRDFSMATDDKVIALLRPTASKTP